MAPELQVLVDQLEASALKNAKNFGLDLVELVPQALMVAAKQTATPIDDAVVLALQEPLKAVLKELVNKIKG